MEWNVHISCDRFDRATKSEHFADDVNKTVQIILKIFHVYRGYHNRLTLECNNWFLVRLHLIETLGLELNHIRLQHFDMIEHAKRCSLM